MEKILFGGDYNPEQWPRDIWTEDMNLFEEAHIDTVTVGVFTWALIQSGEDTYDFSIMDEIMERLHAEKKKVCLATGTAAHPAWMAKKYPEVTRVDFEGRKHTFGQRHNSCPNSPVYQQYSQAMARKMAERYGEYDNIIAWHINNEYGGICYCDLCAKAFRNWLQAKYKTIEKLNEAWYTTFWSHHFYDWDEIVVPNALSEHYGRENVTAFQGISLDYLRFNSDSMLENFIGEKKHLKEITPDLPVTTNMMGLYKTLDYFKWAKHLDIISWDNYPPTMQSQARMALTHDLMRGLKQGQPFWLMEQTPSTTACRDVNPVKRPGVMRLWSYQAVAHGSDSVLFFQMRHSKGASEKYHGAIINHGGRNDTRVFKEVKQLGQELTLLGDAVVGARTKAKVALLFDWDSWWAVELSDGPTRHLSYQQTMIHYYQGLYKHNISIDVISIDQDLDQYDVVLAPLLHMMKEQLHQKIERFVERGGSFITTYLSGIVDENDQAILEDRPGLLKNLLGIRIDETDTLEPTVTNEICIQDGDLKGTYDCRLIFDVIQLEGAEAVAAYGKEFYAQTPVITKNTFGKGDAWYLGSQPDLPFLEKLFKKILDKHQIVCSIEAEDGVEITERHKGDKTYVFVMNHQEAETEIVLGKDYYSLLTKKSHKAGEKVKVASKDVLIFEN